MMKIRIENKLKSREDNFSRYRYVKEKFLNVLNFNIKRLSFNIGIMKVLIKVAA